MRVLIKPLAKFLLFAMLLATLVCWMTPSAQDAQALNVSSVTAQPNSDSSSTSSAVIGGQPTRITWEGTVDKGEQVSALTIKFPDGCALASDADAQVSVLSGLKLLTVNPNVQLNAQQVAITFSKPIDPGLLIRVQIHEISLPAVAGDYQLDTIYTDANGKVNDLGPSQNIKVQVVSWTDQVANWLSNQGWVQAWNSVTFLSIFFNPVQIVTSIPQLFIGWLRSLGIVLIGFPIIAIPVGLLVSFMRMSSIKILRFLSSIYVNLIRGTPLFLQIYIVFFGLPFLGININNYILSFLVMGINSSGYLAEIFRGGIESINKGQFEAASSLGMNRAKTMFYVIIPQTVRRVIPTATSEFILLYKDTSLLAAVGVMEQMMFAKNIVATSGNMTPYIVAAIYYLIVTLPLTRFSRNMEKKLANSEGGHNA
jgi:polar amino acid transport system substrate-binding protein